MLEELVAITIFKLSWNIFRDLKSFQAWNLPLDNYPLEKVNKNEESYSYIKSVREKKQLQ